MGCQVLEQRFGDCKDKAVLLVSLLRALGIQAEPALVSTWAGERTSSSPPSPFAFNHAIVHLRRNEGDLWLDPTRTQERGPLASSPIPYGQALIVDPSSSGLTVIDQAPLGLPTIASRETFVFDGPSAALEVTTTYRGLDADGMRQRIAGTPREKMSADSLEYYSAIYPAIRAAGPIDFTDDPARDPIVVTERYAVKDPLGQAGWI